MKLINKIWQKAKRLIQKRNEDDTLIYNYELCKNRILQRNQENIIAWLIPAIKKEYFKSQGLLICDEQARFAAIQMFNACKETGDIDEMNNYIGRARNAY